jgi:hypothetical protein
LFARALGVKAVQRRGDEMHATLEKVHEFDPERVLALLRKGELAAAGPDAFRLPRAFAGTRPHGAEVCARAARLLASMSRAALCDALPAAFAEGAPA